MERNEFMAGPAGITIMYDDATALLRMSKSGQWQLLWVVKDPAPGQNALHVIDDVSNCQFAAVRGDVIVPNRLNP